MDFTYYLDKFHQSADQLDKGVLHKKQIEVAVGVVLNSVCLKLYKKSWSNSFHNPLTAESRIFFSVWINEAAIKEQKLFYNIHALKLRQLKNYSIKSRQFAETFRATFKEHESKWENVSVKFGPLTLMEGWLKINLDDFQAEVLGLANNFLEIEHLIDKTLVNFKNIKR